MVPIDAVVWHNPICLRVFGNRLMNPCNMWTRMHKVGIIKAAMPSIDIDTCFHGIVFSAFGSQQQDRKFAFQAANDPVIIAGAVSGQFHCMFALRGILRISYPRFRGRLRKVADTPQTNNSSVISTRQKKIGGKRFSTAYCISVVRIVFFGLWGMDFKANATFVLVFVQDLYVPTQCNIGLFR